MVNGKAFSDPQAKRPHLWGWILAYGILLLLLAVLVATSPLVTGVAVGIMLGIVLCIYGAGAIYSAFVTRDGGARWLEVLIGVIAIVAGLFALLNPVAGSLSLVWAIGLWLVLAGVFQIIIGARSSDNRFWNLALGVLDVVLGVLLMGSDPATGLFFLAFIVAFSLAVRGVFLIMVALGLRKMAKRLNV